MNCHEFETELDRCVEEKLSPTSQLIDHASTCTMESCCDRWEEFTVLACAIDAWMSELPQVDLTDHLLALHKQSAQESVALDDVEVLSIRSRVRRLESNDRFPAAMAAVVSLLVSACLLIAISIRPTTPQLAHNDSKLIELASQETQLEEFGKTTAHFMNGATSRVTSTVSGMIPDRSSMLPAEMSSTSAWLNMWSERIEPLEDKLDSTVRDFVKETLSDMTDSAS